MNKYERTKISGIGKVVTGKTPATNEPNNYGSGYMFIGPTDLHKHFVIRSSEKTITEEGLKSIRTNAIDGLSVLVGCIGWDIGNVALVDNKCATNQQINAITKIKTDYNPYYIYYWLRTKKDYILQRASVTRTPILNKTAFSDIEINVPEKHYQNKVVAVLSSLDAKIDLNNRINAELEAMAKTLYDYWFVQFDFPCPRETALAQGRPELEGKPYKSSGGRMVWNAELKREIPEGWDGGKLGSYLKVTLGGTPSTSNDGYWRTGTIPWLSSAETSNFPVLDVEKCITESGLRNSAASLLPKGSVVVSIVRYIRPSILGIEAAANQSVAGIFETDQLKSSFIYLQVENDVPRLMSLRTGAQQPHINKETIEESPFLSPVTEVLTSFYNLIDPVFLKILQTANEAKVLTSLRDWLLPMLMNGQVTVE